jgi:hypothetical protein
MTLTYVPLAVSSGNFSFLHSVNVFRRVLIGNVCYFRNSINRFVFITDLKCVLCEGENEHLYRIYSTTNPHLRYEVTNKCVEVVVRFIDTFQILPQHVSAIRCHHQGIVVPQKLLK